ncbi:MAG: hypothetical protein ACK528_15100 [Alphaproteobacteria bacterium]|jgi:hypothetical protein
MDSYDLYWNGDWWSSHTSFDHAKQKIKQIIADHYQDGFNNYSVRKDWDSSVADETTYDLTINGVIEDKDFFTIKKETINV